MKMQNVEDLYPLSPLQKGILFHAVSEPQSSIYLLQFHCTLAGPLNLPAFQRAWQQVLDRHPALRTVFLWEGLDEWLQVVRQHAMLPWKVHDWTTKNSAEQKQACDDFLKEDGQKLFDLSHAPLMRVAVIRLKDNLHRLVWTQHHLILDGWSLAIVLKEALARYNGSVRGVDQQFPPVRPYRDFIVWHRQLDLSQAEFFWKDYLKGFAAPTVLPFYRLEDPEGQEKTGQHGRRTRQLSADLTRSLKSFSRNQQLTLNTVFQGAWALLLSRYSGQDDVVFGAVVSGRPAALSGIEAAVGLFVNTLPFRAIVSPDGLLVPWLQDLQSRFLEARQFEHSPLVDVQGWSEVPRGTPLFDSILAFENYPVDQALETSSGDFQVSDVGVTDPTNYPMTLEIVPGDRTSMTLSYRVDRYEVDTIERLLAQLETLLMAMAEQPKARLYDLSYLTSHERQIILHEWNQTEREYSADRCAYQLVEIQAKQTPEVSAVSCEGTSLTYRELNQQAARLAIRLRSLGVGLDTPVGLCVQRSVEMVVGLLGIWKAGGAYVPLDPTYPDQRLAFMLQDAKPVVVVTEHALAGRLSTYEGSTVLFEELRELPSPLLFDQGSSSVTPDHGAYILYTSGSTGSPKGVLMPHRCLTNLIAWQKAQFISRPASRTLQFASMSFDVSLQEILSTLCTGGTLFIATDEVRISSAKLLAFIREHQLERVFLPPVAFQHLAETATMKAQPLPVLKEVICAGEQLVVTHTIRQFLRLCEGCRLANHYGPTESHVATSFVVEGEPQLGPVPIGRPIANTRVYLLDAYVQPIPVGAVGEVYIGGPCLARGYLNRPEHTVERFVLDPFVTGQRLYRTGDLARFRADGALEFIGRRDHQIQLRGHRIELGEIEQVLGSFPEVLQAVVSLREDTPGQPRLIAYLRGQSGRTSSGTQVKTFLAERVPAYMVPSAFIWLECLPLTVTGKIDRRALPAPGAEDFSEGFAGTAPRSSVEQAVAEIWKTILNVRTVSVHENFFELGGHSLLATQVAARIRETFDVELPLRLLFDKPTLAELAMEVERLRGYGHAVSAALPIMRAPRDRPLPLSYSQQRMWFMSQLAPSSTAYNMPMTMRLRGPLNRAALVHAMKGLVWRHESFRTTFAMTTEGPVQIIGQPQMPHWKEIDLRPLPEANRLQETTRQIAQDAGCPFDLVNGPLARFVLFQIGDHDHIFLLNMHHVIGDQWSFAIIAHECMALYNNFCKGDEATPEPSAIAYADFAVWQRQWLNTEVLQNQLAYWRTQLVGLPVLTLPTDYPRPQTQRFTGSYRAIDLTQDLLTKLTRLSAHRGSTLFMTLLGAFQILLGRYAGQQNFAIGVPIANRTHLSTEGIVGTFVNTLVMRTDLSGNPTFTEVLRRVREVALGAYDHQDLPFERLLEEVSVKRDLSHSPLVQVLFNVGNVPMSKTGFHGLTWAPFEFDGGAAQFDLTMAVDTELTKKAYLSFRTDLFDGSTIERMVAQYKTLLDEVAADPQKRIADYQILSQSDRHLILHQWNETRAGYPHLKALPELITDQAASTPDSIALSMGERTLTYEALNAQANRLARYLRRLGVGRGELVGICLERSPMMVVGLLGILKAGAGYVPLDPDYPLDRLGFMMEDSGSRVIVTSSALLDRIPHEGRHTVCIDRNWDAIDQEASTELECPGPGDVAYVIYTSGSTGKPKGVEITHQALVNFLWSMQTAPGCTSRDVLLSVTTLSFDIAGLELYLPLIVGGRVELASRQVAIDGRLLRRRLLEVRPSIMQATPATWHMLIDAGWEATPHLTALCGGEALQKKLADQILARAGSLWNMYGPTETTIWSTLSKIERGESEIAIGRPIANTQLYILDDSLQPVPIGVPGELYIGGDGVANGYRHRPELTAERFILNPFCGRPGARLYKTGDLARYRSDGHVVHMGRIDHQVKIRGFRIELGEIEAALSSHPAVRQVVVTAREDQQGLKQLAAYLVCQNGTAATPTELRALLRKTLPEYMVPSYFVFLDAMPLTANHKVDVNALPTPAVSGASSNKVHVGPRNGLEVQLAALWQQVLGVHDPDVYDNFFDLGGQSFKAAQLFYLLEEVYGRQFPLATLFEAPTIAELASVLSREQWTPPWRSLVAIQSSGTASPIFAVPGVGGNVLVFAKLAQLLGKDQPFYGLQTRGLDGREAPFTSVVKMAAHYVDEIRSVQPKGPYVIAGTCTGGVIAYEIAQQLMVRHERVILIVIESWHPLSYNGFVLRTKRYVRPLLYVWKRMSQFLAASRQMSVGARLRLGLGKLHERIERIGLDADGKIFGETFTNIRVAEATLEAIAVYKTQEFKGTLLNVTASDRVVADSVVDTRKVWEVLTRGGVTSVSIPAANSGQLFVTPHVEMLFDHLEAFFRAIDAQGETSLSCRTHDVNV